MDKPLTTSDLDRIMSSRLAGVFKGTYPSDHLPDSKNFTYPWCIIANSDCSHNGGSHWLAMYFDSDGNGHYFDSYGINPTRQKWIQFLETNSRSGHWDMQRRQIQGEFTPYCGHYTVYYLLERHFNPDICDYKLMLSVNDSNIIHKLYSLLQLY